MARAGNSRNVVQIFRNVYNTTPFNTASSWIEIVPVGNLLANVSEVEIFDSGGQTMEIGYGPAGSEQTAGLVPPGGNTVRHAVLFCKGLRIVYRAVSANATTGEVSMNFYA